MLQLQGFGQTDLGQARANNEDALWIDNQLGVFAVCDGMGGQAAGDVASQRAIEVLRETIRAQAEFIHSLDPQTPNISEVLKEIARQAVEKANSVVFQMSVDEPRLQGMGTTLLLLMSCGTHAVIAHVGDSRLYLCRGPEVFQLSTDHTLLQEFLNRGYLSKEDAKGHPHGHVLLRAVGHAASIDMDLLYCEVLPGDTLILCSDGLSRYLDAPGPLADFCEKHDLEQLPTALTQWANEQGGRDNITVVAIRPMPMGELDTIELSDATYSEFYRSLDVLQQCFLTHNLSLQGRMRLLNLMESVTYEPGAVVYAPGDQVSRMLLVLEGALECTSDGRVLQTLTTGMDLFSMAMLEPITIHETVTALQPTTVLVLEGSAFRKMVKRKPWLGHRLMKNLAQTLGHRLLQTRLTTAQTAASK